jgi:hypothetical protein
MTRRVGNFVILEGEPGGVCALCQKFEELRPYGPNGERVCYDCAMKDPEAAKRRFARLLHGDSAGAVVGLTSDTHRIPSAVCAACGRELSGAGGQPERPTPGDFTVCLYCFAILTFTDTLAVRLVTDGEWMRLPREQRRGITAVRDRAKAFAADQAKGTPS